MVGVAGAVGVVATAGRGCEGEVWVGGGCAGGVGVGGDDWSFGSTGEAAGSSLSTGF